MTKHPGKKIGTLEVKLDRKKTRYTRASVDVELRFDLASGTFHAQYEGRWYSALTKDALSEQIKAAATSSLALEWQRYIQISYTAKGWPIEDMTSGRPASSGSYQAYDLDDDRTKFDRLFNQSRATPHVICAIELHWSICEISEPYALPEETSKRVRAQRTVDLHDLGPDLGKERIGAPQEWPDDVLPPGTLLWTPEREAVLAGIVAALGLLDARLVALFTGDTATLADKLDAAAQTDPSRLLAAPVEPDALKQRSRP